MSYSAACADIFCTGWKRIYIAWGVITLRGFEKPWALEKNVHPYAI